MPDTKIKNRESETWKDVKGYEGLYQISSWGNVKSFHRYPEGVILKTSFRNKYANVWFSNNGKGKSYVIHRLVAIHFVDNFKNKPQVNHKYGNKLNNYWKDLEWMTNQENSDHAFENGLHNKPRKKVYCPELNSMFLSLRKAGNHANTRHQHISECCRGKRESAGKHPSDKKLKLTWQYA